MCPECTTLMYINHVHQQYNVPKDIIHGMYQPHASINMSTCASTNMPTMCIHQYANHVHLPTCQTSVISLMICLHHEPSTITMYQTNTNCCANQVIPMVYYHQAYAYMSVPNITMHQYHKMMNPIFVCQILHKTCVNQTASRCLYQCTRSVPIIDQVMTPQHDHLINSPTTCPNMYPIHMPKACIKFFNK
jgi:hypothetical protein